MRATRTTRVDGGSRRASHSLGGTLMLDRVAWKTDEKKRRALWPRGGADMTRGLAATMRRGEGLRVPHPHTWLWVAFAAVHVNLEVGDDRCCMPVPPLAWLTTTLRRRTPALPDRHPACA